MKIKKILIEVFKYIKIYLYSVAQVIPKLLFILIGIVILQGYNIFFPIKSLQIALSIIFIGNYFYYIKKATDRYNI